jgi:hypothetical protein
MLDNAILDVALGLVFLYLVLALVCTAVAEAINQRLTLRASTLQDALLRLFDDPVARADFNMHPLIRGMRQSDDRYPSYVPSDLFVRTVLDLAARNFEAPRSPEELRAILEHAGCTLPPQPRAALIALLDDAPNLDVVRERVAVWFDQSMERASGWYRRHIQGYTRLAALAIVVALNADTLQIARAVWSDAGMRREVATQAEVVAKAGLDGPGQLKKQAEALQSDIIKLEAAGLPIGWDTTTLGELLPFLADPPREDTAGARLDTVLAWARKIAGLLASAFAVSLGAPFWFDLLNRLTGLRAGVTERASK